LESLNKNVGRQAGAVQREQQTNREKTSGQQAGNNSEQAPVEPSDRQVLEADRSQAAQKMYSNAVP
jgi:hypothetical protein